MTQKPDSSFRLFQVAGITVYLHYIWLIVAYWQIVQRAGAHSSIIWNVGEYLALFGIVLLHEFGHAFATRQVGGSADTILLWPFGGIAYVQSPPRPGAELWSIAAGPLVNVALVIPFTLVLTLSGLPVFGHVHSDLGMFLQYIWQINIGLLIFNILPIYPLDGGQILRSLLWYKFGPIRSLLYATMVGFVGVAAFALYTLYILVKYSLEDALFAGFLTFYIFTNCRQAYLFAKTANNSGRARPF